MSATSTFLPLLAGPLGIAVAQGEAQMRAQKRAARRTAEAQRLATSRAAAEQRRQEMEQRRLNRRKPNVMSLLGKEQNAAATGPGATLLTGSAGVPRDRLTLGSSSLLGAT